MLFCLILSSIPQQKLIYSFFQAISTLSNLNHTIFIFFLLTVKENDEQTISLLYSQ